MQSAVRDQERGQVCFRLFTWTLPPHPRHFSVEPK